MTEQDAVGRGQITVTAPVLLTMFGLPIVVGLLAWTFGASLETAKIVGCASVTVSWAGAWVVWSFMVTRWRLWAYERVQDISELKRLAVEAGLVWPDGHFFERTEIRTRAQKARLLKLEHG